jgi:sugar/nucleoside kinase (ribokinase family)
MIVCVGAAVLDVLLSGKVFSSHMENGQNVEEFVVGQKYELEKVTYSTGGGATNAAVTFARQGLHPIFMGKIADDPAGKIVADDLHAEGVDTTLMRTIDGANTGYSTILLDPDGDRTVLVYRGVSAEFSLEDFDLEHMQGDWLYISSLAGNLAVIEKLVQAAKAREMQVAMNPGSRELEQADWLKEIIKEIDVLSLNKEEVQQLVEGENDEALVRNCSDMVDIVVMTDGPRGLTATDRQQVISAGMYEDVPVIDRLGAGDAFASGFVSKIAQGKSLAEAIVFGSANSTSVVSQIGAKPGILRANAVLHDMPLDIKPF